MQTHTYSARLTSLSNFGYGTQEVRMRHVVAHWLVPAIAAPTTRVQGLSTFSYRQRGNAADADNSSCYAVITRIGSAYKRSIEAMRITGTERPRCEADRRSTVNGVERASSDLERSE